MSRVFGPKGHGGCLLAVYELPGCWVHIRQFLVCAHTNRFAAAARALKPHLSAWLFALTPAASRRLRGRASRLTYRKAVMVLGTFLTPVACIVAWRLLPLRKGE